MPVSVILVCHLTSLVETNILRTSSRFDPAICLSAITSSSYNYRMMLAQDSHIISRYRQIPNQPTLIPSFPIELRGTGV